MKAADYASEIAIRLATVRLSERIAVVITEDGLEIAEQLLTAGDIAAYVAVRDTPSGVMISRQTYRPDVAQVLDAELAQVAPRSYEVTAAEATALASTQRGAA